MSRTIPEVATDANLLYSSLTGDLDIDFDLPSLDLPTDFDLPVDDPSLDDIPALTVEELTTKSVDGTGVFDVLMGAVNAQLTEQHQKGRITGGDFAKVYMGSLTAVLQFGTQFLLSRDRARLENRQIVESIKLAQTQRVRAIADVHIARGQIQQLKVNLVESELKMHTAGNEYALSKMSLVNSYNEGLVTQANIELIGEQVEVQRAQTWDTHLDGTPITGILGKQKSLIDAQMQTQKEELDTARANTKDTLLDGTPVSGLVALEKSIKEATMVHMEQQGLLVKEQVEIAHAQVADTQTDGMTAYKGLLKLDKEIKEGQMELTREQVEAARAQTQDTLTTGGPILGLVGIEKMIKTAQKLLMEEQVDAQRASTKDTLTAGGPIKGMTAVEKDLKQAQSKYVLEQYETQRGQTRGTLSTGETVIGLVGAQTKLYEQQIVSYKRDAESKGVKMLLDTWTARKTIDDGVAVPANIDTAAINSALAKYTTNLAL